MSSLIPPELVDIINQIIAHEEELKREREERENEYFERAYVYDSYDEKEPVKIDKIEIFI